MEKSTTILVNSSAFQSKFLQPSSKHVMAKIAGEKDGYLLINLFT